MVRLTKLILDVIILGCVTEFAELMLKRSALFKKSNELFLLFPFVI